MLEGCGSEVASRRRTEVEAALRCRRGRGAARATLVATAAGVGCVYRPDTEATRPAVVRTLLTPVRG